MKLLEEMQRFQSLIVGIIGFAGVIFTLWFNARQTRKQHLEERRHERECLRAALTEELKIIRESVARNSAGNFEEGGAYVPTDPLDDVYRAFTDRIGLLSQAEVHSIMYAYLCLRTYNAKLVLIGVPAQPDARHIGVPAKNISVLVAMQKRLLDPIDSALSTMEKAREG
jgi:hypothetical protein